MSSPECPTAAELAAVVETVLSQPLFAGERCDVAVSGTFTRVPQGGWSAELRFAARDGASLGERHLATFEASCGALRGPAALVIALMVEAAEARAAVSEPVEEVETAPSMPSVPEYRVSIQGAFLGAVGLLPELSVASALGFGLARRGIGSGEIVGAAWLPKSTMSSGIGGEFWGWQLGARVCPELGTTAIVDWGVCAGLAAGELHGRGLGLDYVNRSHRLYAHAELSLQGRVRLSESMAVTSQLGLWAPWINPRFVILDGSVGSRLLHQPEAVIPVFGLGLAWTSGVLGQRSEAR